MFGWLSKTKSRKKAWTKGFKTGKGEHQKQVKALQQHNRQLKTELKKDENEARKERDRLVAEYEKKIRLLNNRHERTVKSIHKRMDYRIDKADKAIKDSERLLKKLKTFETWVVTQFKKSLQSQTSFINGFTHKIDEFLIEQDRIHKELTKIAGEKKMFDTNHGEGRKRVQVKKA